MAYKSGNETKERIIHEARALFFRYGYTNTTYNQLATRAHVQLSTITYHFGSLEKLALYVYKEIIQERNQVFNQKFKEAFPDAPVPAQVFLSNRSLLDTYLRYPNYARFSAELSRKSEIWDSVHFSTNVEMLCEYYGVTWTEDEKVLFSALFLPFFTQVTNMKCTSDLAMDEIWRFYVEAQLRLLKVSKKETTRLLRSLEPIKDAIQLNVSKYFTFS